MSDEFAFIERLRALATHRAARGLLDDAAVLEIGRETLVLTHDTMVEGVHFLPQQNMADVAWKLVATNLSDLAAKGATPVGVLLGHTLGPGDADFVDGLRQALDAFDCALLGGDTVSGGDGRTIGLTAIGTATHTPVPARNGARSGDAVYITGPVGAAMMGFEALRDGSDADSLAFRRPTPRIAEGRLLCPIVTAMMDVSDGVLLDADRLAKASGVTIALDTKQIPIQAPEHRRQDALRWGDDYQLLFTAAAHRDLPLLAYRIGSVQAASAHSLLLDGVPPASHDLLGYRH